MVFFFAVLTAYGSCDVTHKRVVHLLNSAKTPTETTQVLLQSTINRGIGLLHFEHEIQPHGKNIDRSHRFVYVYYICLEMVHVINVKYTWLL